METYVIERTVPGAGSMTPDELAETARQCNAAAATLGVPYVWHESYLAGDRIYCVHSAESVEAVIEHSLRSGLPVDAVTPVVRRFGPETAYE
jgi:hypothetical protein